MSLASHLHSMWVDFCHGCNFSSSLSNQLRMGKRDDSLTHQVPFFLRIHTSSFMNKKFWSCTNWQHITLISTHKDANTCINQMNKSSFVLFSEILAALINHLYGTPERWGIHCSLQLGVLAIDPAAVTQPPSSPPTPEQGGERDLGGSSARFGVVLVLPLGVFVRQDRRTISLFLLDSILTSTGPL